MNSKRKDLPVKNSNKSLKVKNDLIEDLRQIIERTRQSIRHDNQRRSYNTLLACRKSHPSRILQEERAEYGKKIVANVSRQLASDYGNGFSEKNLRRMMQFAEVFPDEKIVVSLIRQLSWTHFIALIPLKDATKRDFYAEMCRIERWNVKTLRAKIDSMLYERTALSKNQSLVSSG